MAPRQSANPWWHKTRHGDRRPALLARGRIRSAIRRWFEAAGFVEVETGCLQVSPGNEAHLHAFATSLIGADLSRTPLHLHTSPEFAMKKLLAAGESAMFQFAPVFRNREQGALHAPEFVMLEWYRTATAFSDPYRQLAADCAAILSLAAQTTGRTTWSWRDRACDATAPPETMSVADAFRRHLGMDAACAGTLATEDRDAIADFVRRRGERLSPDDTFGDIFSRLLSQVEPDLGLGRPLLLTGYPASQSALAAADPNHPGVPDRFEFYCCGIELANGFRELIDPGIQRRNLEAQMAEKERVYGERYPIDEDFIAALAHMPPAAGCALGFDRLVMLATGADRITQVQWAPLNEAP